MGKLCFIIPYFGNEEYWFRYFIKSLSDNIDYNWLIVTDFLMKKLPENVTHIHISLDKFNSFVSEQLEIKTNIRNGYKICDFKPAFGQIFKEHLKSFDYWGYCDTDLIFGNIHFFLKEILSKDYDIISPSLNFFPGHCMIFKNSGKVNYLYKEIENYKDIYSSDKNFYLDEYRLKKGVYVTKNRQYSIARKLLIKHKTGTLIRNNFPFLNRLIKKNNTQLPPFNRDFNSLLNYYRNSGQLKIFSSRLYEDDFALSNRGIKIWTVLYKNGNLYYDNKDLLYFHFQLSKRAKNFQILTTPDGFKLIKS